MKNLLKRIRNISIRPKVHADSDISSLELLYEEQDKNRAFMYELEKSLYSLMNGKHLINYHDIEEFKSIMNTFYQAFCNSDLYRYDASVISPDKHKKCIKKLTEIIKIKEEFSEEVKKYNENVYDIINKFAALNEEMPKKDFNILRSQLEGLFDLKERIMCGNFTKYQKQHIINNLKKLVEYTISYNNQNYLHDTSETELSKRKKVIIKYLSKDEHLHVINISVILSYTVLVLSFIPVNNSIGNFFLKGINLGFNFISVGSDFMMNFTRVRKFEKMSVDNLDVMARMLLDKEKENRTKPQLLKQFNKILKSRPMKCNLFLCSVLNFMSAILYYNINNKDLNKDYKETLSYFYPFIVIVALFWPLIYVFVAFIGSSFEFYINSDDEKSKLASNNEGCNEPIPTSAIASSNSPDDSCSVHLDIVKLEDLPCRETNNSIV